jgi:AcrR family transcriptional regulator
MVRTLNPERRNAFLSAALKLFVANGVQNTSTAEIAREAGTAAGTLFLYFPTKQALISELALIIGREQADNIQSRLEPSLSARDTFFNIWSGAVGWFLDHVEAYRYIQQVRDSGMVSESVVQESNQFFRFYYEAIQKGLQEGAIKPYPPEVIGGFLYHGVLAVTNLLLAQPDPVQREEVIRMGFDIFWDGISCSVRPG